LGKIDSRCKSNHKNDFESYLENDIYPKFSHMLQYTNITDIGEKEIFCKATQSLHNSLVDTVNMLVNMLKKVSGRIK